MSSFDGEESGIVKEIVVVPLSSSEGELVDVASFALSNFGGGCVCDLS